MPDDTHVLRVAIDDIGDAWFRISSVDNPETIHVPASGDVVKEFRKFYSWAVADLRIRNMESHIESHRQEL